MFQVLETDRFDIIVCFVCIGTPGIPKVEILEQRRASEKANHIRDSRHLVSFLRNKAEL